ncbi:hypothetical protein ACE38W_18190 [Chitinophaga sp. Hz27]|uniref:hypothetical protein n=1 Tax=Chitinophaga sp. Hz27 TaxID=3347169 RepID=UPI0035DE2494
MKKYNILKETDNRHTYNVAQQILNDIYPRDSIWHDDFRNFCEDDRLSAQLRLCNDPGLQLNSYGANHSRKSISKNRKQWMRKSIKILVMRHDRSSHIIIGW